MNVLALIPRTLWPRIIVAAVLSLIAGGVNAALLGVLNRALPITDVTVQVLVAFVSLSVLLFVTRFLARRVGALTSTQVMADLHVGLSRQIMDMDLKSLEKIGRPRLIGALTDDLFAIAIGLAGIPQLLAALSIAVSILVYDAWLSPRLLAVIVGVAIPTAALYLRLSVFIDRALRNRQHARDALHQGFDGAVSGAAELRLSTTRRGTFLAKAIERPARKYRELSVSIDTLFAAHNSFGVVSFFAAIGCVLFLPHGPLGLSDTMRSGAALSILYLIAPLDGITSAIQNIQRAEPAVAVLRQLGVDMNKAAGDTAIGCEPIDPAWEEIRLSEVEHAYPSEIEGTEFKLGPIDLTIRRGEVIFVVGGNGSGKSTLAKVLCGLYTPASGTIWLGNEKIGANNLGSYRELFSTIFTTYHLFDDLALLNIQGVDARAMKLLKKLRLDHKVSVADGRLTTTNLSTGQRKRLALLVSYLEDRPVYVFDEWASDQDPLFKNIFYSELLPELREAGKTVIVISHDDRYFSIADEVVKMDTGKISSEDTSSFMWRLTK